MLLASFLNLMGIDSNTYVTCNPSITFTKNKVKIKADVIGRNGQFVKIKENLKFDFFTVEITYYTNDDYDDYVYFSFYDVNDIRFCFDMKSAKGNETIHAITTVLTSNIAWATVK